MICIKRTATQNILLQLPPLFIVSVLPPLSFKTHKNPLNCRWNEVEGLEKFRIYPVPVYGSGFIVDSNHWNVYCWKKNWTFLLYNIILDCRSRAVNYWRKICWDALAGRCRNCGCSVWMLVLHIWAKDARHCRRTVSKMTESLLGGA